MAVDQLTNLVGIFEVAATLIVSAHILERALDLELLSIEPKAVTNEIDLALGQNTAADHPTRAIHKT
jgi:hypothetical protein